MSELTEREIDSLTECECGHYANEHSSDGCLATDFSEADDRPVRDDDVCSCSHSPSAITRHAVEAIKAAARAEGARDIRTKIEALADRLSGFDCTENPDDVPLFVDVPDDYEAGIHDAARGLRALLADGGEPQ